MAKMYRAAKASARNRWYAFLRRNPVHLYQALRQCFAADSTNLATVESNVVPARIEGFHDLSYLFACHQANRGIIAQDFDEAAYLWKVMTSSKPRCALEIGRWLGGSTVLLSAAAAQYGGVVVSVDSKVQAPEYAQDSLLDRHLKQLGLDNYELVVASSGTYDPGREIHLAFIDGDHSYQGVKEDFGNVKQYLASDGELLFHDSCAARKHASTHDGVARLMQDIARSTDFQLLKEVGSITHWKKLA